MKERFLKRTFDIAISSVLLIILSPLFLVIAVLLKIEGLMNPAFKGPVFYGETRVSKGRRFKLYKFRTVKSELMDLLKERGDNESITTFTSSGDYLTPTGRFLAKRYLDECPQLFNVLTGDMSFVGPRPHYLPQYESDLRHGVTSAAYIKAGLCGLTQASKANARMEGVLEELAKNHGEKGVRGVFADKLYFAKYKTAPAREMLFFDIWIMCHCLIVSWRAKGLG